MNAMHRRMHISCLNPLARLARRFRRDESASTAVEAALIMPVLIFFTFGIIEFALVMFDMNRANDATQRGVRQMVIQLPIPADTDLSTVSTTPITCTGSGGGVKCDGGATVANAASFTAMVTAMQVIYPGLTGDNVTVTYSGTTGIDDAVLRPGVNTPLVTVSLTGLTYNFILAGAIPGIPASITLPAFSSSMVGPSLVTG